MAYLERKYKYIEEDRNLNMWAISLIWGGCVPQSHQQCHHWMERVASYPPVVETASLCLVPFSR